MGAWPVFGFFGLDVLVIYWAFRINFRRAAATEEITVTPSELRVRRVSHRGHVVGMGAQSALGAARPEERTRNSASSGFIWSPAAAASRSASFLGPDEKASFAKALMAALQAAKRGPTYNPDRT